MAFGAGEGVFSGILTFTPPPTFDCTVDPFLGFPCQILGICGTILRINVRSQGPFGVTTQTKTSKLLRILSYPGINNGIT
jgi:hypothetical protein